jgi:isopenicillin N synthase-like dioxygenase/RNA:NAD 2'-phosphotransferase (TPT1/KptA family)
LSTVQEDIDAASDAADGDSSCAADGGSSVRDSLVSSLVSSAVTDSKHSARTYGKLSAFTAPPRYRNSGAFVHGSKFSNFRSIMEHGLKAAKSEIFMIDEVRIDGRVPGLHNPPEILIFIDENKARSENMEFHYDATQGTWTTTGIGGVIRPWFFQKVVDQRRGPSRGNVLFQSKEDPMMQANHIKTPHRPRYLLHATYWENVSGIMERGILPAQNPTSSSRQPFKELLQGAESHVYTVSLAKGSSLDPAPATGALDAWSRTISEPEVFQEEEEEDPDLSRYMVSKDDVGLDRPPDAFFVIDTQKAEELGVPLELVQSADREETIYVQGPVPREVLSSAEPNEPVNLPDGLRAKIVDPRSFNDIPIIDLSWDIDTLVEKMQYACEVVGFMQVIGHGVSTELQERHMELQKRFFQLPPEVKARIALNDDCPVRGYFGKGGEDLDQVLEKKVDTADGKEVAHKSRKDNKEALDTNGVPWSKPHGGFVAEIFGMPSRIPEKEELPGFKETLEEYASEMFRISKKILTLMARVLGKPPDFFDEHLTNPVATHRLLHYWPIKNFDTEIGVGEHTDYGLLTVLKQDNVGGLQVLNAKDGRWIHCCPVHDAFVVNLGDMLARWTGHRFKSTVHRVVNISPKERYSVPYFLEPNMDSVIAYGAICMGPRAEGGRSIGEHQRRCRLRKLWRELRETGSSSPTAEEILERFYRASGQLKVRGFSSKKSQA